MRSFVVVMGSPTVYRQPGVLNACGPVQVRIVGSEFAVESLDEGVLGRLAWLDEVQLHAVFLPRIICV